MSTLALGCDVKRSLFFLYVMVCLFSFSHELRSEVLDARGDDRRAQEFVSRLGPGINAFSYDPYWRAGGVRRISNAHLDKIRAVGFKTMRVNLMAFSHMDDSTLVLEGAWLTKLDSLIEDLLARGFNVILDEHDFEACRENIVECERRLLAFWSQLADRYSRLPGNVVFEILNEPSRQITPDIWNSIVEKILPVVRKKNPSRYVIVGPANFNNLNSLSSLRLPLNDRNIIVGIHYYEPLEFTHQRFPSGKWFPTLPFRAWGSESDRQKVLADFARAQEWAVTHRRPLLLGEFGSYEAAPLADRAEYARFVAMAAERFGWAWIYWQFDKSFSIYNFSNDEWVGRILKPLLER